MKLFNSLAPNVKFIGPILFVCSILEYNVKLIKVDGASMHPTLNHGDFVVVFRQKSYSPGDIVIFQSPDSEGLCIKRIISDFNVVPDMRSKFGIQGIMLNKGFVWVEGDYNSASHDSNSFGPLPRSLILGKAIFTILPRLGLIENVVSERYKYRLMRHAGKFTKTPWYEFKTE